MSAGDNEPVPADTPVDDLPDELATIGDLGEHRDRLAARVDMLETTGAPEDHVADVRADLERVDEWLERERDRARLRSGLMNAAKAKRDGSDR